MLGDFYLYFKYIHKILSIKIITGSAILSSSSFLIDKNNNEVNNEVNTNSPRPPY